MKFFRVEWKHGINCLTGCVGKNVVFQSAHGEPELSSITGNERTPSRWYRTSAGISGSARWNRSEGEIVRWTMLLRTAGNRISLSHWLAPGLSEYLPSSERDPSRIFAAFSFPFYWKGLQNIKRGVEKRPAYSWTENMWESPVCHQGISFPHPYRRWGKRILLREFTGINAVKVPVFLCGNHCHFWKPPYQQGWSSGQTRRFCVFFMGWLFELVLYKNV